MNYIIAISDMDDSDDLAVLANDTEYGLAAYLYTSSLDMGLSLSRKIDAGDVCVNEPCFVIIFLMVVASRAV